MERIFGRKEATGENQGTGETVLKIDDIPKLLEKRREDILASLIKNVKPKYVEMQDAARGLESGLKALADSNPSEEIDDDAVNQRILSNALAGRKSFLAKAGRIAHELGKPLTFDFDSVLGFRRSFSSLLKNINDTTVADYRLFSGVFEKESASVSSSLKRIDRLSSELGRMVDEGKKDIDSVELSNAELAGLRDDMALLQAKKLHLEGMERKIEELDGRRSLLKDGISGLARGRESEELGRMVEEEKRLQERISQRRSELSRAISQLEKPMRKYGKLADSGMSGFKDKRYIQLVLDDPVEAILARGAETFTSLLDCMGKSVSEGRLELKDRAGSTMAAIRSLAEMGVVAGFVDEIKRLSDEIKELRGIIVGSRVSGEIKRLESELESAERETAELKAEMPMEKTVIGKIRSSIAERKARLEGRLSSITGMGVRIADAAA